MTSIEYVRYRIDSARQDDFVAAYASAQEALEASPNCISYELSRCQEEPDRYILRIEWDSVDGHLQGFRKSAEFKRFFAAIKPYIGDLEEMHHYERTPVMTRPSIYEAVGGVSAFFRLAATMHEGMKHDDLLSAMFAHSPPSHVPHLAMWMCEVFGGPALWTDTLGDIGPMLSKHANLNIAEDQRARFAAIALRSAQECLPADQPEAIAAIARYFDWGTGVAVDNSKPGHVPDAGAGVPTWSWES